MLHHLVGPHAMSSSVMPIHSNSTCHSATVLIPYLRHSGSGSEKQMTCSMRLIMLLLFRHLHLAVDISHVKHGSMKQPTRR